MEFWTSERRGAVEIATFSNPPRNYIGKPQLDAKVALSTFVAVDPDERRDWFESANSKNYPAYSGH